MVSFDGVIIELLAEDLQRLAAFYEGTFGLSRAEAAGVVTLTAPSLVLRIKKSAGDLADPSVAFGFRLPAGTDLAGVRDALVAAGAIVLSESKRGEAVSLACQDPAGNDFVVSTVAAAEAAGDTLALAPVSAPAASAPSTSDRSGSAAPAGRPSRADLDRLRDTERLASMQETIAGLHMPFTANDPATALAEMRAKLGGDAGEHERRVAEADAEMRARERAAAVDDLFERYRREARGEAEPTSTPTPPVTPAPDAEAPAETSPTRTLGRSSAADDDQTN